jgi:hypothetical protein
MLRHHVRALLTVAALTVHGTAIARMGDPPLMPSEGTAGVMETAGARSDDTIPPLCIARPKIITTGLGIDDVASHELSTRMSDLAKNILAGQGLKAVIVDAANPVSEIPEQKSAVCKDILTMSFAKASGSSTGQSVADGVLEVAPDLIPGGGVLKILLKSHGPKGLRQVLQPKEMLSITYTITGDHSFTKTVSKPAPPAGQDMLAPVMKVMEPVITVLATDVRHVVLGH